MAVRDLELANIIERDLQGFTFIQKVRMVQSRATNQLRLRLARRDGLIVQARPPAPPPWWKRRPSWWLRRRRRQAQILARFKGQRILEGIWEQAAYYEMRGRSPQVILASAVAYRTIAASQEIDPDRAKRVEIEGIPVLEVPYMRGATTIVA